MKNILIVAFCTFVLLAPLPTFASDMWVANTPNNLYAAFSGAIEDMSSESSFCIARNMWHYNASTGESKRYDLSSLTAGVLIPNNDSGTYDVSASTTYTIYMDGEDGGKITANFVYKNDVIYVQFPDTLILKSNWISVPKDDYEEFAIKIEHPMLFNDILHDRDIAYRQTLVKIASTVRAKKLFQPAIPLVDTTDINEPCKVSNATENYYAHTPKTLQTYFKELPTVLSRREQEFSISSLPELQKALKNKKMLNTITSKSLASVSFDNVTKKPIRTEETLIIPDPKNKNYFIIVKTTASWSKGTRTKLVTPTNLIPLNKASELLGIKMFPMSEGVETALAPYKSELLLAKTNSDRADAHYILGASYEDYGNMGEAVSHYKKAASFYPKESADQYNMLALAENANGNGKSAKTYFESALAIDPDSMQAQFDFGSFLNGITKTSAPYQDIERARELNEGWDEVILIDENLISLYVSYILSGEEGQAKKLIRKFSEFETGKNYMTIARAYHRLGNVKMVKKYLDLAEKFDTSPSAQDLRFLGMTF